MSANFLTSGTLSQKKLDGIYWKSFVDFVNKDNREKTILKRREGSFEYMELTSSDTVRLQWEYQSNSSAENSLVEEKGSSMPGLLDMKQKKEIHVNDGIGVLERSPSQSSENDHSHLVTLTTLPSPPDCSPIQNFSSVPRDVRTPSPVGRNSESDNQHMDACLVSDSVDTSTGGDSFDKLESTSPSMEPAPWKDQCEMIQRWMVPRKLSEDDEEVLLFPEGAPTPDFVYCHYVPTLEAIMEESEEYSDTYSKSRSGLPKSASFSEISDVSPRFELAERVKSSSVDDLSISYAQSQDDLYSIATTFGSFSSVRRMSTFENLSFDEDVGEETDGSSDELDRVCGVDGPHCYKKITAQECDEMTNPVEHENNEKLRHVDEQLDGKKHEFDRFYDATHYKRGQTTARGSGSIMICMHEKLYCEHGYFNKSVNKESCRIYDDEEKYQLWQIRDHEGGEISNRQRGENDENVKTSTNLDNDTNVNANNVGDYRTKLTFRQNCKTTNREPGGNRKALESSLLAVDLFPTVERSQRSSEDDLSEYDNALMNEPQDTIEFFTAAYEGPSVDASLSPYCGLESSREAIAGSSRPSLENLELQNSDRESPAVDPLRFDVKHDPDDSISPLTQYFASGEDNKESANSEFASASSRPNLKCESPSTSEMNIPGLPEELFFDSRDIPKIVIMFAQEELEKDKREREKNKEEQGFDGDIVQYRKRSFTGDQDEFRNSTYSPREGVLQRINQIKASEAARLSTLSSSTPELSAMPEDSLLYIPVSYASEAAARKKKKRRATMSATDRNRSTSRTLQSRVLISGAGLGNGFSSLRKRFKSRKSAKSTLTRSQSEKPSLSYSSPDVSGPMSRFLHSPRLAKLRGSIESPTKGDGQRHGIRTVVSNMLRRLSSRFASHNRPSRDEKSSDVRSDGLADDDGNESPARLVALQEEESTSESASVYSSAQGSLGNRRKRSEIGASPQRVNSVGVLLDSAGGTVDFRERSASVPLRPTSQGSSTKYMSAESDVFDSLQSTESGSLDRTIYV